MAKSFLKWAGGKSRLAPTINKLLPTHETLIEPFVGSGAMFLNSDASRFILSDINPHLINIYNHLKEHPQHFIGDVCNVIKPAYNNRKSYLAFRDEFNNSTCDYVRAVLFVYLNRHCFNGLCRFNRKNVFNVSYGKYKSIYLPINELEYFAERAQQATFIKQGFTSAFINPPKNSMIYCDPPYDGTFGEYTSKGFGLEQQITLRNLAANSPVPVAISNSDTPRIRELYKDARVYEFMAYRSIGATKRETVKEILAIFD